MATPGSWGCCSAHRPPLPSPASLLPHPQELAGGDGSRLIVGDSKDWRTLHFKPFFGETIKAVTAAGFESQVGTPLLVTGACTAARQSGSFG